MALLRSQTGPYAKMTLSIDSTLFRVLFLRRLGFPLSFHLCRCGRPLARIEAVCWDGADLRWRAELPESAAKGGRVTLNMMVRDMDLGCSARHDTRRLEVVANGLPLFGGTQLSIDTTLVSTLHCDGSARRGVAHRDGAALLAVRRKKERTYPELIGPHTRARLVLVGEVGRWSDETRSCASWPGLKHGLNHPSSEAGRTSLVDASTLACSAAQAFAASLLNLRVGRGVGNVGSRLKNVYGCNDGISDIHGEEFPRQSEFHCECYRSHTEANVRNICKISGRNKRRSPHPQSNEAWKDKTGSITTNESCRDYDASQRRVD